MLRCVYEIRLNLAGRQTFFAINDPVLHAHVGTRVYFDIGRDVRPRVHVADGCVIVADHVRRVRFREENMRRALVRARSVNVRKLGNTLRYAIVAVAYFCGVKRLVALDHALLILDKRVGGALVYALFQPILYPVIVAGLQRLQARVISADYQTRTRSYARSVDFYERARITARTFALKASQRI